MTNATAPAWPYIRELMEACRTGSRPVPARALADRVIALTDAERTEVARRLPEFHKNPHNRTGLGEALQVVGAGTLPGPAAVATWLTRREFALLWLLPHPPTEPTPPTAPDTPPWARTGRSDGPTPPRSRPSGPGESAHPWSRAGGPGGFAPFWVRSDEPGGFAPFWAWRSGPDGCVPFWSRQGGPDEVVRVLAARPAAFQADVVARVARRIRRQDDPVVPLALTLLRACKTPPPEHDPLVVAWLAAGPYDDDPLAGPLLPRIFEAEGAGRVLRDARLTHWLTFVERRLAKGLVSRDELIDGCLRRFLRGGDAADLRFFVRLHGLIAPTPNETATRSRDYLRLLPAAPAAVAELALAQVRSATPYEAGETIEAITALTFRPETKLARSGLRWLEEELPTASPHRLEGELRGSPTESLRRLGGELRDGPTEGPRRLEEGLRGSPVEGPRRLEGELRGSPVEGPRRLEGELRRSSTEGLRAEELAPALATAFGHASYEVRQRAVRLAVKHATALAPAADVLAGAVPLLPADLGAPVAAAFGGQVGVEDGFVPEPPPEFAGPEPFPEPTLRLGWHVEYWVDGERWLAAFVTGAAGDRTAMRDVLLEEFGDAYPGLYGYDRWVGVDFWIAVLAKELIRPGEAFRDRLPRPDQISPPHLFQLHRLNEIYRALHDGTLPPVLLATPTVLTGHLDPDVLVDRLETCAAAGAEPLDADLCQALLRLPRGTHPGAAARAARLGTPAAVRAAAWLSGDVLPDPETGVRWSYFENDVEHFFDEREPLRLKGYARPVPVLRAAPTGNDLIDVLLAEPSRWHANDRGRAMSWWSPTLPSHREVVAANYLPHLLYQWDRPGADTSELASLAASDGPAGEAFALVVAYFLTVRGARALPSLLRIAATGDLAGEAVGRHLALLIRHTPCEVRPVLTALAELARQGAYAPVWAILTILLPSLLPLPGERPTVTHSDAVAIATEVARWTGARGEIPEVAAHAKTGRNTRFTRECTQLHNQLTGSPTSVTAP